LTRTHTKHLRAYINGVDLSGYSRSIGALGAMAEVSPDSAWTDTVKNVILGQSTIQVGNLSTILDNDTAGAFVNLSSGVGQKNIVFPIGINAAPVNGNPMFAWQMEQTTYTGEQGDGFVSANIIFGGSNYNLLNYKKPWGFIIHAKGTETAVNTATGQDDNGAASSLGGLFVYQLFSSDGTVTLKAQDAATNTNVSFADLTGATSGVIDASLTPQSGIVQLSTTATVRRYTRWQIVLGTATTVTFFMGLIRNNISV